MRYRDIERKWYADELHRKEKCRWRVEIEGSYEDFERKWCVYQQRGEVECR